MIVCGAMALSLYLLIVKRVISMQLDQHYYKFLAVIWGFSLIFPLVSLVQIQKPDYELGICFLNFRDTILFKVIPWSILVILQIRFMVPVVMLTWQVTRNSKNSSVEIVWIYVKLGIVWVTQFVVRLIFGVYILLQLSHPPVSPSFSKFIAFLPATLSLNSLVFLISNRTLYTLVYKSVAASRARVQSATIFIITKVFFYVIFIYFFDILLLIYH